MCTSSVPLLLLLLVTSWECFMFCFWWLTSTTCEHHFLCIFELPSVLSVGRPQETCPNCTTRSTIAQLFFQVS
ncbi:unnamed protein product [Brassica rapa subsp. trilocularis]